MSTEFTPKKHGGEKGVPFRIQAETYSGAEQSGALLHCAASQVKVFKVRQLYYRLILAISDQDEDDEYTLR